VKPRSGKREGSMAERRAEKTDGMKNQEL